MNPNEKKGLLKAAVIAILITMAFVFMVFCMLITLNSCSYSINQVCSEGTTTDLIDETQTTEPKIKLEPFNGFINRGLSSKAEVPGA